MKKRNIFTMLLLMAAVSFTFTACLGDDDDNNNGTVARMLTVAERTAQAQAMQGFYTGNLYFDNDSTNAIDSVEVYWEVTAVDSTISLPDFPLKSLAKSVSSTTAKNILNKAVNQTIRFPFYLYFNENIDLGYYTFMLLPPDSYSFTVDADGKNYQVTINFTSSLQTFNGYGQEVVIYPTGAYKDGNMSSYFLIRNISIDYSLYSLGSIYLIVGKK